MKRWKTKSSPREALLREWLFEKKKAEVLFVMDGDTEVGFALFFHNFSTFLGRAGIYLEDLYVRPAYRGKGYGKALLRELAQIAVNRGCGRLEWSCLDWNQPSIDFYKSLGAVSMDEWTVYRAAGDTLLKMAGRKTEDGELRIPGSRRQLGMGASKQTCRRRNRSTGSPLFQIRTICSVRKSSR